MKQEMEAEMARIEAKQEATRQEVEQMHTEKDQKVLDLKARLTHSCRGHQGGPSQDRSHHHSSLVPAIHAGPARGDLGNVA